MNKTAFPDPYVLLCILVHFLLDTPLSLQELQAVYLEGEVEKIQARIKERRKSPRQEEALQRG